MLQNKYKEEGIEVGCDEAGRGCLAGPVVAAAVIIPENKIISELNDSKKMTHKKRMEARGKMIEQGYFYGVGIVSETEIDEINILQASFLAMHRALDELKENFDRILVDGNRFNTYKDIEHHCIVKGDAKFTSIAAASIFAKTERDLLMEKYHLSHPEYDWKTNKGYPTKKHREAIEKFGASPYHRKTFKLLSKQTKLPY